LGFLFAHAVGGQFLMDKHVVQAIGNVAHSRPSSSDEVAAAMVYTLAHQQIRFV
jgi:hypothetical protein